MSDQTLYIMYYLLFYPPIIFACWIVLAFMCDKKMVWTEEDNQKYPDATFSNLFAPLTPIKGMAVNAVVLTAAVVVGWSVGNAIIKNGKK